MGRYHLRKIDLKGLVGIRYAILSACVSRTCGRLGSYEGHGVGSIAVKGVGEMNRRYSPGVSAFTLIRQSTFRFGL